MEGESTIVEGDAYLKGNAIVPVSDAVLESQDTLSDTVNASGDGILVEMTASGLETKNDGMISVAEMASAINSIGENHVSSAEKSPADVEVSMTEKATLHSNADSKISSSDLDSEETAVDAKITPPVDIIKVSNANVASSTEQVLVERNGKFIMINKSEVEAEDNISPPDSAVKVTPPNVLSNVPTGMSVAVESVAVESVREAPKDEKNEVVKSEKKNFAESKVEKDNNTTKQARSQSAKPRTDSTLKAPAAARPQTSKARPSSDKVDEAFEAWNKRKSISLALAQKKDVDPRIDAARERENKKRADEAHQAWCEQKSKQQVQEKEKTNGADDLKVKKISKEDADKNREQFEAWCDAKSKSEAASKREEKIRQDLLREGEIQDGDRKFQSQLAMEAWLSGKQAEEVYLKQVFKEKQRMWAQESARMKQNQSNCSLMNKSLEKSFNLSFPAAVTPTKKY